jgi:hypothetical protein
VTTVPARFRFLPAIPFHLAADSLFFELVDLLDSAFCVPAGSFLGLFSA